MVILDIVETENLVTAVIVEKQAMLEKAATLDTLVYQDSVENLVTQGTVVQELLVTLDILVQEFPDILDTVVLVDIPAVLEQTEHRVILVIVERERLDIVATAVSLVTQDKTEILVLVVIPATLVKMDKKEFRDIPVTQGKLDPRVHPDIVVTVVLDHQVIQDLVELVVLDIADTVVLMEYLGTVVTAVKLGPREQVVTADILEQVHPDTLGILVKTEMKDLLVIVVTVVKPEMMELLDIVVIQARMELPGQKELPVIVVIVDQVFQDILDTLE